MAIQSINESTCVVRATGSAKGRTRAIAPGIGGARLLHYGRIVLDGADQPLSFANSGQETGFVCLRGSAEIRVAGGSYKLSGHDSLYVPRDASITVAPGAEGCDLVETSAPVESTYPVQFVSFAEAQRDPALHAVVGGANTGREVTHLLGKNVQAGRLMVGLTVSKPGNWTSWPPHEHAARLEEAYLFVDMPAPSWGVQFVYTDPKSPELVTVVREGDAVMIAEGYHPNVATPGNCLNYIWILVANRERDDRVFGVVNVQPEFAGKS
jgi:5-deoxy-glucuronate isomerase